MTERLVTPTPETIRKQRESSDPESSVWVAANAGSGKTHVLTERVLRLLLTGVSPQSILCLTYTKAAAAEMRGRVTTRLGGWTLMDDAALTADLEKLTGQHPSSKDLAQARALFANALETPGGLKINTIHAFCESVLHRFPLEAGVPFGFAVIEEAEQENLIRRARETILTRNLDADGPVSAALNILFDALSDSAMENLIASALKSMRNLGPILADVAGAKARLREFVAFDETRPAAEMHADFATGCLLSVEDIILIRNELEPNSEKKSATPTDLLSAASDPTAFTEAELRLAFFTDGGNGTPRKKLLTAPHAKRFPALAEKLAAEQQRLIALCAELTVAELVERSEALIDLIAAIVAEYERLKRARARLDFDDLIGRTAELFARREQAAWVRYKLDAGITHILVDESQDTNPEQWLVVDAIADEFFAGDGAVERSRSLFAVGDQKQSIFSFQGAEPALFGEAGRIYAKKAQDSGRAWRDIELKASFRTLDALLKAIDLVFADPGRAEAILAQGRRIDHESARTHTGGMVTLWPLIEAEKAESSDDIWALPETSTALKNPARQNAECIAATISDWLKNARPLGARGRAVNASDILILVQSRGPVFLEIIRALKSAKLPTPGADRLRVTSHIAVLDLLALADVLLNPADDLGLAALLRSPLFHVSEGDLFALAHGRGGTLFEAMQASALPSVRAAAEKLSAWRARLDFDRPYEFYTQVLLAEGGLKDFHARLGAEVDDVLAEFLQLALAQEQSAQPSLQGFVAELRSREVSVKRELSEAGGGIRVMTIHGAKGLEAPIVILADAATVPQGSQVRRELYFASTPRGPFLFHAGSKVQHTPITMTLYDAELAAQRAEYWRRLYVAMTRAEDELHIAGVLGAKTKREDTWYGAIETALADQTRTASLASGLTAEVFPAERPSATPATPIIPGATDTMVQAPTFPPLPAVLSRTLLTPSAAGHGLIADPLQTGAESLRDADQARHNGIALHALLQHLPRVAVEDRSKIAAEAVAALFPNDSDAHAALVENALAILANSEFSTLFGPNSRAELPVLAKANRDGESLLIAGRIDRLCVTPEKVTIVDFKSDATPPADPMGIPPAYVAQLGLYRLVLAKIFAGREVEAKILWTASHILMSVPASAMAAATNTIALD